MRFLCTYHFLDNRRLHRRVLGLLRLCADECRPKIVFEGISVDYRERFALVVRGPIQIRDLT